MNNDLRVIAFRTQVFFSIELNTTTSQLSSVVTYLLLLASEGVQALQPGRGWKVLRSTGVYLDIIRCASLLPRAAP